MRHARGPFAAIRNPDDFLGASAAIGSQAGLRSRTRPHRRTEKIVRVDRGVVGVAYGACRYAGRVQSPSFQPMTVREFAERLVRATDVATKLEAPPRGLPDVDRGEAVFVAAPGRTAELTVQPGRKVRVPSLAGMPDPAQRVRILHALANHELQAAELFAWALLAFPDAPSAFRRGCLVILAEEQEHCRLYVERLAEHGAHFGAFPVTGHFWHQLATVRSPLEFLVVMGLTFENANLDFTLEHADAAREAGDEATAAVLERVHHDEIRHVRFARRWVLRFDPTATSLWEAYERNLPYPLTPSRARGKRLDVEARRRAGLGDDFVQRLTELVPRRPGGAPRV